MKPHLIFIDIDGTLIHDDQTISPRTKEVIEKLQSLGHIVYIATGRMRVHAELVRDMINAQVNLINSNGAMYDLGANQGVEYLGVNAVEQIINIVNQNQVSVRLFTPSHVYHNVTNKQALSVMSFAAKIMKRGAISYFKEIGEIDAKTITNGIIAGGAPDKIELTRKLLGNLTTLDISSSAPENIELLPKGVSKATAVKHVQMYYQINRENTLVFGNGENDIPMLEAGDISVAMQNSTPDVFDHAKYVTGSNEEDGVAEFLEKYFQL
ncbi:HAD family hydrolase [Periweissella fabalis]|uniref:HAD family hydrolase n=1 Tax=Periweissella fabalis TaxID=1070421 RepID=A0A7X6S442_9LACO|nr:HAD family hydrolase [Periweissella fabalis]MCM0599696.1 HAD family hydrolase [Periweissella fabalis]NKZ24891.1 HAD family hydrolase [Periweissella fabalis]